MLGGDPSLKIDDVCKVLTKPMVVSSLNYDLAKKLIQEKKVNYIQKGKRKTSLKFHRPMVDIGDILHVNLMKRDLVVINRQPTFHRPSMMRFRVVPRILKHSRYLSL